MKGTKAGGKSHPTLTARGNQSIGADSIAILTSIALFPLASCDQSPRQGEKAPESHADDPGFLAKLVEESRSTRESPRVREVYERIYEATPHQSAEEIAEEMRKGGSPDKAEFELFKKFFRTMRDECSFELAFEEASKSEALDELFEGYPGKDGELDRLIRTKIEQGVPPDIVAQAAVMAFSHGAIGNVALKREKSDVRQLVIGCRSYASDHDGNYPPNLQTLVPKYIRRDAHEIFVFNDRDGNAKPWKYVSGLTDTSPSFRVLIVSPGTINDKYVVGRAGGYTHIISKAEYRDLEVGR